MHFWAIQLHGEMVAEEIKSRGGLTSGRECTILHDCIRHHCAVLTPFEITAEAQPPNNLLLHCYSLRRIILLCIFVRLTYLLSCCSTFERKRDGGQHKAWCMRAEEILICMFGRNAISSLTNPSCIWLRQRDSSNTIGAGHYDATISRNRVKCRTLPAIDKSLLPSAFSFYSLLLITKAALSTRRSSAIPAP